MTPDSVGRRADNRGQDDAHRYISGYLAEPLSCHGILLINRCNDSSDKPKGENVVLISIAAMHMM